MTKAGQKLIEVAKQALQYARCRHKWARLSTRVESGKITGQVDLCDRCGTRRTQQMAAPVSNGDQV
jgi:hypothetical protein